MSTLTTNMSTLTTYIHVNSNNIHVNSNNKHVNSNNIHHATNTTNLTKNGGNGNHWPIAYNLWWQLSMQSQQVVAKQQIAHRYGYVCHCVCVCVCVFVCVYVLSVCVLVCILKGQLTILRQHIRDALLCGGLPQLIADWSSREQAACFVFILCFFNIFSFIGSFGPQPCGSSRWCSRWRPWWWCGGGGRQWCCPPM